MKHKTRNIFAGVVVVCGLIGWTFYSHQQANKHIKVHGTGTKKLSCPDSQVHSFSFLINGKEQWTRPHKDFLKLPIAVPSLDRRFKGENIVPLAALLKDIENIQSIEVIPCDSDNIVLSMPDIKNHKYYFGLNHFKRMKLLEYTGDQRYETIQKNVIQINIIK